MSSITKRAVLFLLFALGAAANGVALTPPPSSSARITPATFASTGGDFYVLTARLNGPVRVFFDAHDGVPQESLLLSVTTTEVRGLTPAIATGREQKSIDVYVLDRAGTVDETRVRVTNAVTFSDLRLPPEIDAISPNSTPLIGGARLTIFGSGFRSPAQLFLVFADGSQLEMQVVAVSFAQIVAVAPPARMTGAADLRVLNIFTGESATLKGALRYTPPMTIDAVTPGSGQIAGGTHLTIDGNGFGELVSVTVAGVQATVIRVTATSILAIANAATANGCENVSGPVIVTNLDNGDTAQGGTFTYFAAPPCPSPRRRTAPR